MKSENKLIFFFNQKLPPKHNTQPTYECLGEFRHKKYFSLPQRRNWHSAVSIRLQEYGTREGVAARDFQS